MYPLQSLKCSTLGRQVLNEIEFLHFLVLESRSFHTLVKWSGKAVVRFQAPAGISYYLVTDYQ